MTSPTFIDTIFRPQILTLSAYHVADAKNLIKLDAMENPYRWPDALINEWLEHLRNAELNRYPDPYATQLAAIIRTVNHIPQQSGLLLGNGSDEIIQLLLMALPAGSQVLTPEPGFVMYKQVSLSLGLKFLGIPLLPESFELDLPAMLSAIEQHKPALIFLAYPNNPTGNLFDQEAIQAILKAAPGLVILDEAYAPFANASFMTALPEYPQLLVMRTVSKLGLAGLRLGYIAGHPTLIEQLNKIRLPYNINILTQITAHFALSNNQVFAAQTAQICTERSRMLQQLNNLGAITAYPSAANFILFRTPTGIANAIFNSLKQQGVLIKNLTLQGGILNDCLRVTIGTAEENNCFIAAIKIALNTCKSTT
ncbi:MAG: histidinol-phosphate transaminase [Methylococcaceae bacterium]|nr:histidinol-phosphate transaminase [Methylococcaceae bacterium]